MSDKFVEKYTVGEDLVKSLNKKDATAAVLYDLIGRDSNCDYAQQIIDGVKPNEPLNVYIKANYGANVTTSLPQATRVYLNTDITAKNAAEVMVGLNTTRVLPFTYKRNLITSRKTLEDTSGVINASSFYIGGDHTMGYDFTFTVFDGTHAPGGTHPAPTFTNPRLNLDNKDANMLQIDLVFARFQVSIPSQNTGTIAEQVLLQRVLMHPQDIIDQKMMRMSGLHRLRTNNFGSSFQLEVVAKMIGSDFNYAGTAPMIGFFKQNNASLVNDGVPTDTSNFIDFIENELIV